MSERTIGGKYSLEREVGQGGMGSIWVALDSQLQRRVALKLMRSDSVASESARTRFQREAMAIAQSVESEPGGQRIVLLVVTAPGVVLDRRQRRCARQ